MSMTPYTIFQSFWIVMGLWMLSKLVKMCWYEILIPDGGEKYLRGELCLTKQQKKEMSITGIIIKIIQNSMKNIKNR